MFSRDFWTSDANHVAVNPHRPADAQGLAESALELGLMGMCLFQTSGSEGRPKWVALTKEAFLLSAQAVNAHFEVTNADRWLIALPEHHVGGFAIHARAYVSNSTVIKDGLSWRPETFVGTCLSEKITLVSIVPTQVFDLVRHQLHAPDHLRAAVVGGGALSPTLAQAALALGWPIFESYGMTEAASQIATQEYPRKNFVSGSQTLTVLPHWQVRTDRSGRLVICGDSLARFSVIGNVDGQWSWQSVGEAFVTRDIVSLKTCGGRTYLSFIGRESGFVKILGELVHLAPLQSKLDSLSLVHGLVLPPVIATVPDPRSESRLILVTECEMGAGLLEIYNQSAEPLCQLKAVVRVPNIPRTAMGKIDAAALRSCLSEMAITQ